MRQSGNALFLILIAVALFAALSYAVTQSGRGGGSIDRETAVIAASQLQQYASSVEQALLRLRIVNGCSDTEIGFDNTVVPVVYAHANGPADNSCEVFDSNGGGLSFQPPPNGVNDGTDIEFTSRVQVFGQGQTNPVGGGHDAEADLVFMLRGVTEAACTQINTEAGLSGIPVDAGDLNQDYFDGDYSQLDNLDGCPANCSTVAASPIGASGVNQACIEEGDTGDYIYFYTLIAR